MNNTSAFLSQVNKYTPHMIIVANSILKEKMMISEMIKIVSSKLELSNKI